MQIRLELVLLGLQVILHSTLVENYFSDYVLCPDYMLIFPSLA